MVLAELREAIEQPWQAWELAQADTDRYRSMSPAEVRLAPLLFVSCLSPALQRVARCVLLSSSCTARVSYGILGSRSWAATSADIPFDVGHEGAY